MMVAKKDFDTGDLVWAKMKGFPFWPGKIANPPTDAKSTPKKAQHYVFFFGSENYAWILDENIVYHSEEMLQSASKKKKSTLLKTAIGKIIEEAPQKTKTLVKEKESPEKSSMESPEKSSMESPEKSSMESPETSFKESPETSFEESPETAFKESPEKSFKESPETSSKESPETSFKESPEKSSKDSLEKSCKVSKSSTEKKTAKKQRIKIKTESLKARKKFVSQRRIRKSAPAAFSKKPQDISEFIYSTPPNINFDNFLTNRQFDDPPPVVCPTGINKRSYYELQPIPDLNLETPNEAVSAKNVKPTNKNIGFIGLGMIGQRLVKNLLTTGHKVTIWNRTPDKCEDFVKAGAFFALTPSDVIEKCDITFCCVSGPQASISLVFGNCGILSGLESSPSKSKGYVEMTTIDPKTSIKIAEAITQKGGKYIEAPISGSRKMADDGALLILGAGDRELFIDCESCFNALTKHSYYLGSDIGIGSKMNLVYSMLKGTSHAALAEAMTLVERSNLQPESFLEILELVPVNSALVAEKAQAMLSRYFATNSSLKYQQKDLHLVLTLGNMCKQRLLVTAATNELFKHAKLLRYSEHDTAAVFLGAKY